MRTTPVGRALPLVDEGCVVAVLPSAATRAQARRCGFVTHAYRRVIQSDVGVPFEAQAQRLLAQASGVELAHDVLELSQKLAVHLLVVDRMPPALAVEAGVAATCSAPG